MQSFYNSFGFLIGFMVLLLLFQMLFGNKFSEIFMMLVLASMIVMNGDKVKYLLRQMASE